MQLDECIALPAAPEEIARAVDRSLAWAERCKRAFARPAGPQCQARPCSASCRAAPMPDLRAHSADALVAMDFPATPSAAWRVGEPQASHARHAGADRAAACPRTSRAT